MNTALADIVGRLTSAGRMSADDVLMMRKEIYGQPAISPDDLEALAALDVAAADRPPEWGEFLAEAIPDYVVRQEDPQDYVDQAKATWVMHVCAGELKRDGLMEVLVRVIEGAVSVPAELDDFVLAKVKAVMIAAGRLTADDAALVKRVVFAGASAGNVGVTLDEADALFDINDVCAAGSDAAWTDFFAKAVADYLTAVSPFKVQSREAAAADEAWLEERESPRDFIGRMAHLPDVKGALNDILHPYAAEADEWREAEAGIEAAEAVAAQFTDEESAWLVGRLGAGELSEPERRLISLLREIAPQSTGVLAPLLGPAQAAPAAAATFGTRQSAPLPAAPVPAPAPSPFDDETPSQPPVFGKARNDAA
jgi:hypothetical protein